MVKFFTIKLLYQFFFLSSRRRKKEQRRIEKERTERCGNKSMEIFNAVIEIN